MEMENPTTQSMSQGPVIAVFCGSSPGNTPAHLAAARALAHAFHANGVSLVYGGGTLGIMGEVAKTLVGLSGPQSVHGVIPQALVKFEQRAHVNSSGAEEARDEPVLEGQFYGKVTVVNDMHTRKRTMAREVLRGGPGSGFVALSGGYGTLEELMEVVTWNQLGIHGKGIVVFNVDGYWDGLFAWMRNAVTAGFVSQPNSRIMLEAKEAEEVLRLLREYKNSEGKLNLQWEEEGSVA